MRLSRAHLETSELFAESRLRELKIVDNSLQRGRSLLRVLCAMLSLDETGTRLTDSQTRVCQLPLQLGHTRTRRGGDVRAAGGCEG